MPIKDYPFTRITADHSRPMLWVRVTNPATSLAVETLALVDTGADDCVFPAEIAEVLGHKLTSVPAKQMITASGTTIAYPHTSKIEVLEMLPNGRAGDRILYTLADTPIDFARGCQTFLLGARKFLSKFLLTVNYPHKVFSLRKP